ncbi:hypothetical protein C1646_767654 [Rhizophagus diaphanus]|nr:hypothetical protein C1646_767654 [Rhizophagus diaphanus] [Rhizophagus sp. MUCL 43196]
MKHALQSNQKSQDSDTDSAEGNGIKDGADTHITDADVLNEFEQDLLKKFYNKVNKFKHSLCIMCNESFLSIVIIGGILILPSRKTAKKFLKENNMNLSEVPDELCDLTGVEEILVAQIFPMMSVYRLREKQHGYQENVINFSQNVQEFTLKFPRHPSLLDVLIICYQSVSNAEDINEDVDYNKNEDDIIIHTFIPLPPSANWKDTVIRNTLD